MSRLGMFCLVLAACGERTHAPIATPATPPAPPTSSAMPAAPATAHHTAPACPLAPIAAGSADENAPREGLEGESRIATAPHGDRCATADSNIERVEKSILALPDTRKSGKASKPWDGKSQPQFAKLVEDRLAMTKPELALLAKNGFVVLGRHEYQNYAQAYHEIYQSQLPVFISIDSVLHAIYAGNESVIADLEDQQLRPLLADLLDKLACTLPAVASEYPADTTRDLDLYLAVARALLRAEEPTSMFGDAAVEDEARALVKKIVAAQEMDTQSGELLFGRRRVIDFTAYTPRSHYAKTEERQRYFRASMWLSRIELNLVSRSSRSSQPGPTPDPSETPREDIDALALADLVNRARLIGDVDKLDTAWALLAGRREDVSIADLIALRRTAGIAKLTDPDAAAKLRTAIGDQFQRTARLHYMPEGSTKLPAITTFLGPRVVPDAAATRPLVAGEVPDRGHITAADMAYVLGHDHAKTLLAAEIQKYPSLGKQLDVARRAFQDRPRGTTDLYSAWLDAVGNLASYSGGALPSFVKTDAYADLRVNTALAAFGHLKHNFVLIAGESYFEGGCVIPDGYVEPAPAAYEMLIDYAKRGKEAFAVLDPSDSLGGGAYYDRLGRVLSVLERIQDDEIENRPLDSDERAFLSMVSEMEPGTTGGPPTYTGWWFDMFRLRELDGLAPADFIASYFTGESIAYVGATAPHLGVFVVDTGGAPRLMVGPIARAYEYQGPVAHRLDDAAGKELPETDRQDAWAKSYFVPAPPEPKLKLAWTPDYGEEKLPTIDTKSQLGPVTLELFDHHRTGFAKLTKTVGPGKTQFAFPAAKLKRAEGIHLHAGEFDGWYYVSDVGGGLYATLGGYDSDISDP